MDHADQHSQPTAAGSQPSPSPPFGPSARVAPVVPSRHKAAVRPESFQHLSAVMPGRAANRYVIPAHDGRRDEMPNGSAAPEIANAAWQAALERSGGSKSV